MNFRDLKKQYEVLKKDIDVKLIGVAESGMYIGSKEVNEIEQKLAKYVGVKHCISCANGTDALSIAMMTWGIGSGDAVFVPDFTFFSSGEIVSHCGATPVFVDVYEDTFNMNVESLELAIKSVIADGNLSPKCIIPVDLFGLPADMNRVKAIADKYNLLILEDAAQGFGGSISNQMACSFGDIATTSFFPAKPLGCYGDGGAIFTNDDNINELARSIKVHGKGKMKYDNVRIGLNSRLDAMQAAVLSVKLSAFEEYELKDVNDVADKYTKALQSEFGTDSDILRTPVVPKGFYSSWAQYTIRLADEKTRDGLKEFLADNKIPSMIYYPKPMHEQEAFNGNRQFVDLSTTEKLSKTVLSLPMHPYLTDSDIDEVVTCIKKYFVTK